MIISRTPFRLSLFGGGTDYPDWFKEHGGAVVGTTIDKYCYISVRRLPPFFEHRSRIAVAVCSDIEVAARIAPPGLPPLWFLEWRGDEAIECAPTIEGDEQRGRQLVVDARRARDAALRAGHRRS